MPRRCAIGIGEHDDRVGLLALDEPLEMPLPARCDPAAIVSRVSLSRPDSSGLDSARRR